MRISQVLYACLRDKDRLMQKVHYGELNADKNILMIRPNSEDGIQGLMSLFVQAMRWVDFAQRKNFVPYINFKDFKTQYFDGENNVWDFFFTQPSSLSYNEVMHSKNVILSGVTITPNVNNSLFRDQIFIDKKLNSYCSDIFDDNLAFSHAVEEVVQDESQRLDIQNCIGVYIRGTDYVKLRPSGEYVQPSIEQMIQKIREFMEKHPNNNLFLVTEDNDYYQRLKCEFGEQLLIASFDSFIENYSGNDFLSKSSVLNPDLISRGRDYLVKIVLLSRCKYFIGSITMGSIAAYSLNGNRYNDAYIFKLGYYR